MRSDLNSYFKDYLKFIVKYNNKTYKFSEDWKMSFEGQIVGQTFVKKLENFFFQNLKKKLFTK